MEGIVARWYAGLRGTESQLAVWRAEAAKLTRGLPDGSAILEVAPGPGYHAIELARLGRYRVTAIDISRTFVQIATEHARKAGVDLEVRLGDASDLPFADGSFDLIVCQAAFKNFSRPIVALDEMHRVLRIGGVAVIQDMNRAVTGAEIRAEVRGMQLNPVNAFMTRMALTGLRRRAYAADRFREMAEASAFRTSEITADGMTLEVRLTRR